MQKEEAPHDRNAPPFPTLDDESRARIVARTGIEPEESYRRLMTLGKRLTI